MILIYDFNVMIYDFEPYIIEKKQQGEMNINKNLVPE